jgi:PAS domain S-box-containing protein
VTAESFLHLGTAACLLVAAALAAGVARRDASPTPWRAAAIVLAALGLLRALLTGRSLGGAVELLLAAGLLACLAALAAAAGRVHHLASRAAALGEDLERSEKRYMFLLNSLPEAFVVLEGETIFFANRAFARIFGVEPKAALGRRLEEFIVPDWRAAFRDRHGLESTTPGVGTRRLELLVVGEGGREIWVEMRLATSGFEDRPAEVVLIADISERRRAERRLQRITETMLELGGDFDANVRKLTALCGELLGATCAMYNRLQGEMLCTLAGWQLPPDYPTVDRAQGHLCHDLIRARHGEGPLVVGALAQTPYADSDPNVRRYGLSTYAGFPVASRGRTVGSLCVVYQKEVNLTPADLRVLQALASALGIEEERQHGRELQRAAQEIAEATEHAGTLPALCGIIHDIVSRFFAAPSFFIAVLDRATETLAFPYFAGGGEAPEPGPQGRRLIDEALRSGRVVIISPEMGARPDERNAEEDQPAWVSCVLVPLEDRQGPFAVLGVASTSDGVVYSGWEEGVLTVLSSQVARAVEHLLSEEQLRQSELKYRTLVNRMQDGVFLLQGSRLLFCNEALASMLGYSPAELEGREFLALVDPEDRELVLERYRRRQAGEGVPEEYEFRLRHADGRRVEVLLRVGLIEYQGRPATLGTLRDLTERRRLEAQLRQAQRIEALGQLAGGVAHDFNNLLMAIQGSAQLLQQRLGEGPREELATILSASRRAAQLTRGLLAFAQRQVLQPQPLDLNRHIQQMLPILRRVIPESIGIDYLPSASPLVVEVDTGQLDQILMNLVVNSRDAMENGGRILIRTAAVEIGPDYKESHPWAKLGGYAHLQVCDTGLGMDAQTLAHAFEPFFTTKGPGRGTGLGLSTVYGIVKQHGGMIDVASEPGSGTIVDVYFPIVDRVPLDEAPRVEGQADGGSERILVVEDEEEVRQVLREALREAGYEVWEAGDGAAALDVLLSAGDGVALVISDVVMPRLGGKELLQAVRSHGFTVPFLFSSGYGEPFVNHSHHGGGSGERVAFIAKPYGIEELLRKVREVLTSGPAPA